MEDEKEVKKVAPKYMEFYQNDFKNLVAKVDALAELIATNIVEKPVDKLVEKNTTGKPEGEHGIIDIAMSILGKGFVVQTEPSSPGVSFRLIITPPDHLKEDKYDKRIKVIPYLEADTGVRNYCESVRKFCLHWAQAKGILYEK